MSRLLGIGLSGTVRRVVKNKQHCTEKRNIEEHLDVCKTLSMYKSLCIIHPK